MALNGPLSEASARVQLPRPLPLPVMADKVFFFGDWQVDPAANSVRRGDTLRALEPKAMDVLRQLCQQAGEVVGTEELLQRCWPGEATGDNPLHKAFNQKGELVAECRRQGMMRKRPKG